MTESHLQGIIEKAAGTLQWELHHEVVKGAKTCRITSDPHGRRHIIHLSDHPDATRPMDYLHELAHASLAERHYLLATAYFTRGTPTKYCDMIADAVLVAADWLADYLLFGWCPNDLKNEISIHIDMATEITDRKVQYIFYGGLIYAEAVLYLHMRRHDVPRRYRSVANTLLSHSPACPTINGLCNLINDLAGLTCSKRIKLVDDGGMEVWQVI
ncbi:MAG TPA: hypothetical protein P5244_02475 [Syntrophales bacterium]|nr:hypothetical protein [Syntrophales bacterium]